VDALKPASPVREAVTVHRAELAVAVAVAVADARPSTVAVIGEILVDLANTGGARYLAVPGGAPANVAVALSRLGIPTELIARISHDHFGEFVRAHLVESGVGREYCVTAAEPTTLAVATLSADQVATYSFYSQGTADWQWAADELPVRLPGHVRALVVGSLALGLPPGAAVIEQFVAEQRRAGELLIAYDPNIRPTLAAPREAEVARVERQIGLAHLVKASEEDLRWLYPDRDPHDVARQWQADCAGWVTVTCGPGGAFAICPDGREVAVPGRPVQVVDTIGAGDAFLAGLLAGLDDRQLFGAGAGAGGGGGGGRGAGFGADAGAGADATLGLLTAGIVEEIMSEAVHVAALTCTRAGANPPTRQELGR
jgi:fructokinase